MLTSRDVWKIVGIYALLGSLWIIFSDKLLLNYYDKIDNVAVLSTLKGLLFITFTSLLLYILINRQKKKINNSLQSLRRSEERYEFLVKNSLDCLVIVDSNGFQKYVSPGADNLFDYSHEELKGKNIREIVHPDDIAALTASWDHVVNNPSQIFTVQYRHIHKTKNWIECEATVRSFFDDPVVNGIVANVRDITDRKRSERILQKRNQLISTILDNLPIGLAVNHIKEGSAIYMNRKFEEIYGWPKEDLNDIANFFTKVYPDTAYREKLKAEIMEDINSGDPAKMFWTDISITTKKGKRKTIEAKNIPVYEQNLMISTVQDITESRKLQKQLEQLQKLESIGRLAGGIAHDLNNLLTPILGYSDILLEDTGSPDEQRENIVEIRKAGIRARDLVQQLLAFSRKQILKFRLINPNEIIESNRKLLRRTIPEDVKIEVFLKPTIPSVLGDEGQILQVLMNLAVNASDAMPKGGSLTFETDLARLDEEYTAEHQGSVPGDYVLIAVSDTGYGMDEDTAKNIFEPFFSTKGEYGTGLGLATVYGIVKQHGGNIWVYSEPGRGTTFKVYLPVAEEDAEIEDVAESHTELAGEETILLAEDAPQVRRLARVYLHKLGYTVLEAPNGEKALAVAAGHDGPIHLLFTDVVMPGLNGAELYRKMAKERPELKVLYTSGYTDNVIAHRGVLDKDVKFLQKPYDFNALGRKIKEVLRE